MFITGHTATDGILQSDNLKGVWRRRGGEESEGDLKLDWGLRTSIAASSFERGGNALDCWKDEEKLEWKLGRMSLGITGNSQFPDHIYMVSVSEPLCQTISQFHLPLSVPVSQLSHNALSLTTLPPPVPGSARITRPRVLINSDTPAIPRSRKGKRNFGAHPGRRRQYWSEEKRNVRFPGRVRPCVTPTNSENIQLTLFALGLGSHLLEDVLVLRSGASMLERRSKICYPGAKTKKGDWVSQQSNKVSPSQSRCGGPLGRPSPHRRAIR